MRRRRGGGGRGAVDGDVAAAEVRHARHVLGADADAAERRADDGHGVAPPDGHGGGGSGGEGALRERLKGCAAAQCAGGAAGEGAPGRRASCGGPGRACAAAAGGSWASGWRRRRTPGGGGPCRGTAPWRGTSARCPGRCPRTASAGPRTAARSGSGARSGTCPTSAPPGEGAVGPQRLARAVRAEQTQPGATSVFHAPGEGGTACRARTSRRRSSR